MPSKLYVHNVLMLVVPFLDLNVIANTIIPTLIVAGIKFMVIKLPGADKTNQ